MVDQNLYLHALNLMPQLGPARLLKICENFESFEKAFYATKHELVTLGLEAELAEIITHHTSKVNLEAETQKLKDFGIQILTYKNGNYPKQLLEISKFPPLLYVRGASLQADELCFAVVGTRKITNYGRSITPDLVSPLVESGVIIVSGMAFGVDSEAHKIAVNKNKRTIAVLGGGLDDASLYPKHHQLLAHEIMQCGGTLISEYPPGTPNFKQHFIARNRIISGLSLGTLVVECDLESGSLITAKYALEQNRQVYAVPGPIYATESRGPNNLIKMGAKLVTNAADIMEDLNLKQLPQELDNQNVLGDNETETRLLAIIGKETILVNEIIKTSGLEAAEVTSALTFLEMKGRVRNLGGQQYVRSR